MSKILDRQLLTSLSTIDYVLTWGYYVDQSEEQDLLKEQTLLRELRYNSTIVVSAFPGVGKTHLFQNTELDILDSDSSTFDKSKFPDNYITHIEYNIGKVDVILVSSHNVVRRALVDNGIPFALVYPSSDCKEDYINRYKLRGSTEGFIKLLTNNFDNWVNECKQQTNCFKHELQYGEYLSDLL